MTDFVEQCSKSLQHNRIGRTCGTSTAWTYSKSSRCHDPGSPLSLPIRSLKGEVGCWIVTLVSKSFLSERVTLFDNLFAFSFIKCYWVLWPGFLHKQCTLIFLIHNILFSSLFWLLCFSLTCFFFFKSHSVHSFLIIQVTCFLFSFFDVINVISHSLEFSISYK